MRVLSTLTSTGRVFSGFVSKRVLLLPLLFGLFAATPFSLLAQEQRYRVAIDEEWLPFVMGDGTQRLHGGIVDVLREIGERSGLKFEFVVLPWAQALADLDAGRIDILQMPRVSAWDCRYAFSLPVSESALALFRLRDGDRWSSLSDLSGKRVAVRRRGQAQAWLAGRKDVRRVWVDNRRQGFALLSLGYVDAVLLESRAGSRILDSGMYPRVVKEMDAIAPAPLCLAVRKGRHKLIELLNENLRELQRTGRLQEIWQRHPFPEWRAPSASIRMPDSGLLAGLLLCALVLLMHGETKRRMLRHGWWLVLVLGSVASLASLFWLQAEQQRSLQAELAYRGAFELDSIRRVIASQSGALDALSAFIDGEMRGHAYIDDEEAESFMRSVLLRYSDAVLAMGLFPRQGHGKSVRMLRDGRRTKALQPAVDQAMLDRLSRGEQCVRLLRDAQGRMLLRLSKAGEHSEHGRVVLDLDAWYLLTEALTAGPPAALAIDLSLSDAHGRSLSLRHGVPAEDAPVWHGAFSLGKMHVSMRSRPTPALSRRFLTLRPEMVGALVLSFTILLSLLVYRRSQYSDHLHREVRRRTRELAGERQKLACIIDHAHEGILLVAEDGQVIRANPAACSMFGYTSEQLSHIRVHDLVPDAWKEKHAAGFAEEMSGRRNDVLGKVRELQARRCDGSTFPCEVTIHTFRTQGEQRLSVMLRDLSERKQQEWVREAILEMRVIAQRSEPLTWRLKAILSKVLDSPWSVLLAGAVFEFEEGELRLCVSQGWDLEAKTYHAASLFDHKALQAQARERAGMPGDERLCFVEGAKGCCYLPLLHGDALLGLLSMILQSDADVPQRFRDFIAQVGMVLADVLQQDRIWRRLEASEEKHRALVESVPLGILVHEWGVIRYANTAMVSMLGDDEDSLTGRYLLDFIHEEEREHTLARMKRLMRGQSVGSHQSRMRRVDGSTFWVEVHCTPTIYEGRSAVQSLVQDISARKQAEDRLSWLSYYDALTELPNRRLFSDRLEHAIAIARREQARLALLHINFHRFKMINDSLGHEGGDEVLREASRRIREALRESDTAARLGGDEFVVLLPTADTYAAMRVAHKLRQELRSPYWVCDQAFVLDVCIGIVVFPQDGESQGALLRHVELASHHAQNHPEHIHCFSAEMERQALERLRMENELTYAIERGQLRLYYQSQHRMDGSICGVECLLRWDHPVLGRVSPVRFIPLAEEVGLIHALTFWVIGEAARQAWEWEQEGIRPSRIGVNLSAVQLTDRDLALEIVDCIRASGAHPEWMEIEITETAAMHDSRLAAEIMDELVAAGLSIAIDDFGTGYSSLSYLKRLPARFVKIDQSFVRGLPNDAENAAIVRATISMAHALGNEVIAEGVEDMAQLAFLQGEGCDIVQGYLYCQPMPGEEATAFLRCGGKERT